MRLSFLTTTVLTAVVSLTAVGQSFSGAIYTSLFNGNAVNQNLYDQLTDVYLNGGPRNTKGGGLPNGRYYFQVVDPSAKDLLSSDKAVCRQLEVIGGYVKGVSPASVSAGCAHVNGTANSITGAIPVQLYPYNQTPNNGNEYKVELWQQNCSGGVLSISPDGNRVLGPSNCNKTDNFKVKNPGGGGCEPNCDPPTLSGFKYYDGNVNGVFDNGEIGIAGFRFTVTDPFAQVVDSPTSDGTGNFAISNVAADISYTVCELLPPATGRAGAYWSQTQPASNGCYTAKLGDGTLAFGNVCFQTPSGGYTLGFWSNKNGQAAMTAYGMDKALNGNGGLIIPNLSSLNLRNPNGSDFDPANYAAFRNWLLNGNAVNMAYMLSVQMATTFLDTKVPVGGNVLPASTVVLTAYWGPRTIQSLLDEADAALAGGGTVNAGAKSPQRQYFENLKNTFDDINNNRLPFVLGNDACQAVYPQ